jgi:PQQ enzyme repeat
MKTHLLGWSIVCVVGVGALSFGCSSLIGLNEVPNPSGDGDGGGGGGMDGTVADGSHPKGDGGGGNPDGSQGGGDSGPGTDGGGKTDGKVPPPDSGADTGASVVEYHAHPSRDGHYIDPLMTKTYAANMKFDTTFIGTSAGPGVPIAGPLWGQVLYVENGVGGKGTYYSADDGNNIYAIDETTGNTVWSKTPLLTPAGTGQCPGNIQPLGITSAPYIDLSSRTMYLSAATGNASGIKTYYIYALSIDDGSEISGWPIDVSNITSTGGTSFNAGPQNQRGGLSLLNGYLYVIFGGQDGDCGNYNGWVISVPVATPSKATGFATAAQGGGMWVVSGMASDGVDMFTVSGNATGGSGSDWTQFESEGVLRFHDGTAFDPSKTTDYFSPQNWQSLDGSDTDLTGAGPLVVDVPGATPSALVLAFGKSGIIHILDRSNLGGIGTGGTHDGLYSAAAGSADLRGAPAAYTTSTGTYVVVHTDGNGNDCPGGTGGNLVAVQITPTSPPTFKTAWCADSGGSGSPIVTTTDSDGSNAIVWVVGAEGSNQLTAWDGETGANIFNGGSLGMDNVIHWTTPIDVKGRVIVGANDKVYAFTGM